MSKLRSVCITAGKSEEWASAARYLGYKPMTNAPIVSARKQSVRRDGFQNDYYDVSVEEISHEW